MGGNSANFDRRLTKLENSELGVPTNLADFGPPTIVVHEGEDEDKIIKEMEARGEIPPMEIWPPNFIRVIALVIVKPPKHDELGAPGLGGLSILDPKISEDASGLVSST